MALMVKQSQSPLFAIICSLYFLIFFFLLLHKSDAQNPTLDPSEGSVKNPVERDNWKIKPKVVVVKSLKGAFGSRIGNIWEETSTRMATETSTAFAGAEGDEDGDGNGDGNDDNSLFLRSGVYCRSGSA